MLGRLCGLVERHLDVLYRQVWMEWNGMECNAKQRSLCGPAAAALGPAAVGAGGSGSRSRVRWQRPAAEEAVAAAGAAEGAGSACGHPRPRPDLSPASPRLESDGRLARPNRLAPSRHRAAPAAARGRPPVSGHSAMLYYVMLYYIIHYYIASYRTMSYCMVLSRKPRMRHLAIPHVEVPLHRPAQTT